jgi:hypothetical protein
VLAPIRRSRRSTPIDATSSQVLLIAARCLLFCATSILSYLRVDAYACGCRFVAGEGVSAGKHVWRSGLAVRMIGAAAIKHSPAIFFVIFTATWRNEQSPTIIRSGLKPPGVRYLQFYLVLVNAWLSGIGFRIGPAYGTALKQRSSQDLVEARRWDHRVRSRSYFFGGRSGQNLVREVPAHPVVQRQFRDLGCAETRFWRCPERLCEAGSRTCQTGSGLTFRPSL